MTNEEIEASNKIALDKLVEYYQYFAQNKRQILTNLDFIPLVVSKLSFGEIKEVFGYDRHQVMSLPLNQTAFYNDFPLKQLQIRNELLARALVDHEEVQWIRIVPNITSENKFLAGWTRIVPLKNPVTDRVIAFEASVKLLDKLNTVSFPVLSGKKISNLSVTALTFGLINDPYHLTQLQHEVLFMFCHHFEIKEIQSRLEEIYQKQRSADSVRQIIKGLVGRFELNNREELVDFAIDNGYASQIPISMLAVEFIEIN